MERSPHSVEGIKGGNASFSGLLLKYQGIPKHEHRQESREYEMLHVPWRVLACCHRPFLFFRHSRKRRHSPLVFCF